MKTRLLPWILAALFTAVVSSGCAHKPKQLTQRDLRNKTVALVDVDGAKEARLQIEVSLVNEVITQGRFQLVDKKTVDDALVEAPHESDWPRLGRALGADLILAIHVDEYLTRKRTGYDVNEEEDSILSEENREARDTKWKKYSKVKAIEGHVKFTLKFYDVAAKKMLFQGPTEAEKSFNSRDTELPRSMKLLETLTTEALKKFFDGLPES